MKVMLRGSRTDGTDTYDIFVTGEHTDEKAIPKRGLPKSLRCQAEKLLKAGLRPASVDRSLRKEHSNLPSSLRKQLHNINKTIKTKDKKFIGKVEVNGDLHQWYRKNLVHRCSQ